MAEELTLQERVADLEKQVTLLSKEVFKDRSKPGSLWKIVGAMATCPDFAEILRFEREIREADREEQSLTEGLRMF